MIVYCSIVVAAVSLVVSYLSLRTSLRLHRQQKQERAARLEKVNTMLEKFGMEKIE